MLKKHKFNYDLITTKGDHIKSSRNFIHRKSCKRVLNELYPDCVIISITTDSAGNPGGYGEHLHRKVGL